MNNDQIGSRKFKETSKASMMAGYFSSFTHGKAFEVLEKTASDKNVKIIDVGAGTGAFSERLLEQGYTNVEAIEKYTPFVLDVKLYKFDLNGDWEFGAIKPVYDIIVAIEIIEHVHSPYYFLEQIRKIVHQNGHVIVTTPNPINFESRIGILRGRGIEMIMNHPDHRTPIFPEMMEKYCRDIGFEILQRHIDIDTLSIPGSTIKGKLKKMVARFVRGIISKDPYNKGNSNVWLLKPCEPDVYYPGK